jgi:hypothetical protein
MIKVLKTKQIEEEKKAKGERPGAQIEEERWITTKKMDLPTPLSAPPPPGNPGLQPKRVETQPSKPGGRGFSFSGW